MKKNISFKAILKKATASVKRRAVKEKRPVAISENGKVILVYPNKERKVVRLSTRRKKAS